MMRRDDEMDERSMSDEAVEDAVLRYLEETPEVVSGIPPSHDLWPGIEARIGARVLPLGRSPVDARSIRRRPAWLAIGAAAAFLVASTAGVTYEITKRLASPSMSPAAPAQVATTHALPASSQQETPAIAPVAPSQATSSPTRAPSSQVASSTGEDRRTGRHGSTVAKEDEASERTDATRRAAPRSTPRSTSRGAGSMLARYPVTGSDEARVTYDDEIGRLHAVLESRRDQLDPATIATVEQNLHVIDVAIGQARAALVRDPHSRMLNEQLDRTLAKKTQLLRAATLLPSV